MTSITLGPITVSRTYFNDDTLFYEGEVTSAQVGLIHGQAAFHQLLLWTDARFELHRKELVRRQQIPLRNGVMVEEIFRPLIFFFRELIRVICFQVGGPKLGKIRAGDIQQRLTALYGLSG